MLIRSIPLSWSNIFGLFVCVFGCMLSPGRSNNERGRAFSIGDRSQFDQSTVTQIFRSTKCLEGDGSYSSFPHAHAGETNVPHALNDETIVEQLKPYSNFNLDFLRMRCVIFLYNVFCVSIVFFCLDALKWTEIMFVTMMIKDRRLCNLSHLNYQLAD